MSEMIERVARAIDRAISEQHDPTPGYLARAAIQALRNPTREMLERGYENNFGYYPTQAWQAMIDEVLK
jgi:hypothetical protein